MAITRQLIPLKDIDYKNGVKVTKTQGRYDKKDVVKVTYNSNQNRVNGMNPVKVERLINTFDNYHKEHIKTPSAGKPVWDRIFDDVLVQPNKKGKPYSLAFGNHRLTAMLELQNRYTDFEFKIWAEVLEISNQLEFDVLQSLENFPNVIEELKDKDTAESELRKHIAGVALDPTCVQQPKFSHLAPLVGVVDKYNCPDTKKDAKKDLYDYIVGHVAPHFSEQEVHKIIDSAVAKKTATKKSQHRQVLSNREIYNTFGNEMKREGKGRGIKYHLVKQNNDRGWYPKKSAADSTTGQPAVNGWDYEIITGGHQSKLQTNAINAKRDAFKKDKSQLNYGAILNIVKLDGKDLDAEREKLVVNIRDKVNMAPKQSANGFKFVHMDIIEELLLSPQKTGVKGDVFEDGFFRVSKDKKGKFQPELIPKCGWNEGNYKALKLEKVGNVYYYPETSDE